MTYEQIAAYRTAQVTTSSPAAQVVLLYEGAIRYAALSVRKLEDGDREAAHAASLRAQAIVSALRESLDLSAGELATRLDAIYEYIGRRLVEGNLAKNPAPAREIITLLRELLEGWRQIAADDARPAAASSEQPARPLAATGPYAAVVGGYSGAVRA